MKLKTSHWTSLVLILVLSSCNRCQPVLETQSPSALESENSQVDELSKAIQQLRDQSLSNGERKTRFIEFIGSYCKKGQTLDLFWGKKEVQELFVTSSISNVTDASQLPAKIDRAACRWIFRAKPKLEFGEDRPYVYFGVTGNVWYDDIKKNANLDKAVLHSVVITMSFETVFPE